MITNPVIDTHDEQLVAQLYRLGVCHLARLSVDVPTVNLPPIELLTALAAHPQSRLRSALIPLFLRWPDYGDHIRLAIQQLDEPAANTLRLYYQAAVYLQQELDPELRACLKDWKPLSDLFSLELGLPPASTVSPKVALETLGQAHRRLTGWAYNWADSYRQDIPLFLKQLKRSSHEHLLA